ncbi:carbohydrate esterase family 4 protein, partial [Colletotrichum incanum]
LNGDFPSSSAHHCHLALSLSFASHIEEALLFRLITWQHTAIMSFTNTLISLLGLTRAAHAACSNFVIDDFSRPSPSGFNSLSTWTSDDDSMSSITLTGGILSFTPKSDNSSYFYETLDCYQAATKGYKALSLTVKGPKDASFMVEIQSKQACTDKEYKSQWVVISGLTGSTQTVSIALSSFPDANLDGITGFVWSTYSQVSSYQFSNLQFTCNEAISSSTPPISSTASTRSSVSASQSGSVSGTSASASASASASSTSSTVRAAGTSSSASSSSTTSARSSSVSPTSTPRNTSASSTGRVSNAQSGSTSRTSTSSSGLSTRASSTSSSTSGARSSSSSSTSSSSRRNSSSSSSTTSSTSRGRTSSSSSTSTTSSGTTSL